jgi:Fic family protein
MTYNWQLPGWPHFQYNIEEVEEGLYLFAEKVGHISGVVKNLPEATRLETIIETLAAEAIKSSEIEGESISKEEVKSSIRNNLGLNVKPERIKDARAAGIGKLMIDVRRSYKEPLTKEKLWEWHHMLLPVAKGTRIGCWRTHKEPMQVVSGALGRQKVHFEAPPSVRVAKEMDQFIRWYNNTAPGGSLAIRQPPVRAALTHLYFESIHPFEDGNGRIGRTLAEKALSQGLGRPALLSLSRTIERKKKLYYSQLESAQKDNEITDWVKYFVQVCVDAQTETADEVDFILTKILFFNRHQNQLNERQLTVIRRMLQEGTRGFKGGMNTQKYIGITKTSKATATRDLQDLTEKGIFSPVGGGRSTRYDLVIESSGKKFTSAE